MTVHQHICVECSSLVACRIDCDALQDGEPVCGRCAERRFDAIKPIPKEDPMKRQPLVNFHPRLRYNLEAAFAVYLNQTPDQREHCTVFPPGYFESAPEVWGVVGPGGSMFFCNEEDS